MTAHEKRACGKTWTLRDLVGTSAGKKPLRRLTLRAPGEDDVCWPVT